VERRLAEPDAGFRFAAFEADAAWPSAWTAPARADRAIDELLVYFSGYSVLIFRPSDRRLLLRTELFRLEAPSRLTRLKKPVSRHFERVRGCAHRNAFGS
jgi:hypothetical protein